MTLLKYLIIVFVIINVQSTNANHWETQGLKIKSVDQTMQLTLEVLSISQIDEKIENLKYQCQSSFQLYPVHNCNNGRISFNYLNETYHFNFSGWMDLVGKHWDINLTNSQKNIAIHHSSKNQDKLSIQLDKLALSELLVMLKDQFTLNNDSFMGTISADLEIDFNDLIKLNGNYQFDEFSWESTDSDYVLAETTIHGELEVNSNGNGFNFENKISIDSGEALLKDIYLEFSKDMFLVNSFISINEDSEINKMQLDFDLSHENRVSLDIVDIDNMGINIEYKIADISMLYKKYLKSFLSIKGISKAEFEGKTNGKLALKNGSIDSIKTDVFDLYMEIESKKIEVNNLNAAINWHNQGEPLISTFNWDALLLAGMPINQSKLQITSVGQTLKFQDDTEVPIFDGSLIVHQLSLNNIFQPEISIQFDGEVQPISLALITEKMGWPVMNGFISGKIPGMNKEGSIITFDGLLELSVFEGIMQVQDLSIERLFGIAPVIAADINFQNLSLLQITSTYDFGDITGKINGQVNDMRITNWKADRLDAYVESVKVNGTKQLISQRAIDNISSIGGVQGAISRSFLKFFDAFRYKKIGIGCKLRNSICEMSGLKTSNNNYQIVAGQGLPSINIFGYRKFIDWQIFLDRLLNASY